MKKAVSVLIVLLLLFCGFIDAIAERSERELNTLEGTYRVSVTVTNPDAVNLQLNHSYGVKDSLPPDIIQREFTVDIKYVDGNYLLFDKGEELKNSGLASTREFFIFSFMYEVKDSSMKNIMYEIKADLLFNDSTQSFDIVNPKGKASLIYHNDGGYGYIGVGDFTMEKVAGKEEEEPEEDENTVADDRDIPRGITFMKGIVEVKRAGTDEWIRARRNMPLNPGDTVRTGKNSYADLGCSSGEFTQATGSDIMMRPLSIITVPDKTLKVEKKSRVRVVVDDAMKKVYSLFGKEEFEIETPSAVCGIRGTDFILDVDEDGNTTFLLAEGNITVRSKFDNTKVSLSAGKKILSPVDKTLSNPEEMTHEDREFFSVTADEIEEDIQDVTVEEAQLKDTKNGKFNIGFVVIPILAAIIIAVLLGIQKKKKRQS